MFCCGYYVVMFVLFDMSCKCVAKPSNTTASNATAAGTTTTELPEFDPEILEWLAAREEAFAEEDGMKSEFDKPPDNKFLFQVGKSLVPKTKPGQWAPRTLQQIFLTLATMLFGGKEVAAVVDRF